MTLSYSNHDRDSAGLRYVYPVLSRRAGGLSVGINFNTNNACNWRCIYCQVPGLIKGSAPVLDMALLQEELETFLEIVLDGTFYQHFQVDSANQGIKDIAISGNGEPTSVKYFVEAITLIGETASRFKLFPGSHFVLITNGSLIHQTAVQAGLRALARYHGKVWFKFDSATKPGRAFVNQCRQSLSSSLKNLEISSNLCHTKLQTCLVDYAAKGLSEEEKHAYLSALATIKANTAVNEVMLYTIARPSMQPEARHLQPLSLAVLQSLAEEIRNLGFLVSVSP